MLPIFLLICVKLDKSFINQSKHLLKSCLTFYFVYVAFISNGSTCLSKK